MVLKYYYKISTMFENSFTTPSSPEDAEKRGASDSVTHSKKRRKQSNPTRYGNSGRKAKTTSDHDQDQAAEEETLDGAASRSGSLSDETGVTREEDESDQEDEEEDEELRSRPDLQYLCPHCPASFPSDDLIKAHIEEEHVLQLLERQIRQYQFGRNGGSGNGPDQQDLAEHHLSMLMAQRSMRPGSRASSHSSSLSQPESPNSRNNRQPERGSLPRECLEREFGGMLPFPLTGAMPSLGTGPDGKPIPIGMFPPFLFPVMPSSGPGASSGGSVNGGSGCGGGPGSQSRSPAGSVPTASGSFCIFNPEAYCELCNKEFCNKYFLKTHKANKHGIYTGDSTSSCPPPTNNSGNSVGSGTNSNPSPGPPSAGPGLQAQAAVSAAAAAASAFFPAGLVSQPPISSADVQQQPPQVSPLSMVGSGRMVNPDSFCEICQKAFCNKYFLKKHKHKIHGIQSDGSSLQPASTQDSQSSSPTRTNDHCKASSPNPSPVASSVMQMQQQQQQQQQLQQPSPQSANGKGRESENGIDPYGGIGLKDFCNKYFAKDRKQKLHQEMFDIQAVVNNIQKAASGQQALDIISNSQLKRPLGDRSRSPTPNQSASLPPVTVANPANSPKNYCNICNKELCNKYFMKTHMLKMHGINIDEQPGEAAQASTIGGVTCDICQKELCSKYFLKVHKQNTHGIYEESSGKEGRGGGRGASAASAVVSEALGITSVGSELASEKENSAIAARGIDPKDTSNRYFSHYTEVCPLCQRRFKSIKWLKTHVLNDHSDLQAVRNHPEPPPPPHAMHDMGPEAALSLVVSPKSLCNSGGGSQQRESPASRSSPQSGPSLPPDFACLNWLRSHIPNAPDQERLTSHHQNESTCEEREGVRVGVKRERCSPSQAHRRQAAAAAVDLPGPDLRKSGIRSPPALPALSPQFAIPQKPVAGGSFFMQAFNISEPEEPDSSRPANFVPSLVYLPVARQVKHPVVVAFQLSPA